jgi:HYR domain
MTRLLSSVRGLIALPLFVAVAGLGSACDGGDGRVTGLEDSSRNDYESAGQASRGKALSHVVESADQRGHKARLFFDKRMHEMQQGIADKAIGKQGIGNAPTNANLIYPAGGGPVMRNPTNYLIFWQPPNRAAFPAGYVAAIEKFFNDVGGTPFYNIVTEYGDSSGAPVPNATALGAPSFVDTTTAAPSGNDGTTANPLTDADIQNEVTVALAANPAWARPSVNVEYFVFTPSDVDECFNATNCFATSGEPNGTFCAYHTFFGSNTIYAYMPFASAGSCFGSPSSFPNGATVDVVLSAVSHEMIESNTDPFLDAWKGPDGLDDEIGDKCAFLYGYVAPDGTNIVLNGDRYQVQIEWSNAVTGCDKRYGATPGTSVPSSLDFGEVAAGTTSTTDLVIQNLAGGDLDILNIRLGSGSSSQYSLLNVPPTAATLKPSESLTVRVRFAPPSNASFAHPTAQVIVDTDDPAQTTYTTNVSGTVGVLPVAACHNVTVPTDPNLCTTAVASVNNGSFDPDGETVSVVQTPGGPYTLGVTPVVLTVTDSGADHETATCSASVTVQDLQLPSITCPAPQSVSCTSASGAAVQLAATTFDNCPGVTAACQPPSGSIFGFGSTQVTCTATDGSNNSASCQTSVTVTDVPPVISSVVASPNILLPPNKKLQSVAILVSDSDVCDPNPSCAITAVTANVPVVSGVDYIITGPLTLRLRASGNGGHPVTYQVTVTCSDHHGGSTSAQTSVQAPV